MLRRMVAELHWAVGCRRVALWSHVSGNRTLGLGDTLSCISATWSAVTWRSPVTPLHGLVICTAPMPACILLDLHSLFTGLSPLSLWELFPLGLSWHSTVLLLLFLSTSLTLYQSFVSLVTLLFPKCYLGNSRIDLGWLRSVGCMEVGPMTSQ